MIKEITATIGGIIIIISNGFIWEIIGITLIVIPLIIPKKRKTFTRIR